MNLKYYLRGLGIGIMVTTIIMSVATGDGKEKLSDAEIKARAAELGMVEESGRLSELAKEEEASTPEPTKIPEPTKEPEATKTPEPTMTPEPTKEPEATKAPEATQTPKPTKEPEATKTPEPTKTTEVTQTPEPTKTPEPAKNTEEILQFTVNQGESSYTICKKLKEYGLISSADAFDTYLYEEGLDKRLRAGTFEIPADSTPEEIAKILTF